MTILTTGVTSPNGNTPLVARQEIRTLLKDTDVMDVFILGLERFQSVSQSDPLSWFQIAGIHGRPYIPYDGAGDVVNFGGYCTHSSILFPPWHRPYLALFEQTLSKYVKEIANEFPNPTDKQRYTAAAERFRVPYWDWAISADLPDFIARQAQVTVNSPQGTRTLNNPLYSYKFNPVYSNFGDGLPDEKVWESWTSTLRWPTSTTAAVRDRTYNLLTQATTYEAFSNDGFLGSTTDPTYFDSLESIHGQIHGMTGRNGHMAVVDYAAFDPVFWLHHCNCDRIFAMWQALNPQQYVIPKVNQAGTFATKPGTIENVDSPLQPFWKAEGVFWTAAEVRDTRTFNYTYPELMKWSTLTPEQKSTRLRTDINTMYGQTAAFAAISPELFSASAPSHPVAAMAPFKPTATVAPTHRAPATSAPAPAPIVAMARPPMEKEVSAAPVPSVAAASTQSHPAAQPVQTTPHEAPLPAGTTSAPSTMAATAGQKMEAIAPTSVAGTASTITTKAVETATTVATAATGAAQKVAAAVPPSVSQPVVSGANTMAGMAQGAVQRVVAAAPPSVTSAANTGMEKFTGAAIAVAASLPPVHPAVHDMLPASVAAAVPRQEVHAAPHEAPDDVQITGLDHKDAQDGKKRYNEWLANITVEKYAAQKTFFVYIFLGDFSEDPSKWGEDANLVGTHVVFANNMNFSGCERCRDAAEAHKLVTGTIPLTGALGDRLGKHKVGGLESQEIVPYLKQNLHWRIQAQDEAVIERKDIPSLTVSVAHVSVVLPDNIANFPTWGASQKEAEVTKGRPGGAEEHD